jgi:MYXO-CTERM domain-containing protein
VTNTQGALKRLGAKLALGLALLGVFTSAGIGSALAQESTPGTNTGTTGNTTTAGQTQNNNNDDGFPWGLLGLLGLGGLAGLTRREEPRRVEVDRTTNART